MKIKYFILIGLCCISYSLFAQYGIEWSKIYGGLLVERPTKVLSFDDEILLAGTSNSPDFGEPSPAPSTYKSVLLFLEKNGDFKSLTSYEYSEFSEILDIVKLDNGDFLCAGNIQTGVNPFNNARIWDYWLMRIDPTGKMLWSKTFGGSKTELLVNIYSLSDNQFMLVGTSESDDGDISNHEDGTIWLLYVDSLGKIISDKSIGNEFRPMLFSSIATQDGNYILGSNLFEIDESWDFNLMKVSPEGEVLWLSEMGGESLELITDLKEAPNGDIVFVGEFNSENEIIPEGDVLVSTDSNGDFKWAVELLDSIRQRKTKINITQDGIIDLFSTVDLDLFPVATVLVNSYDEFGQLITTNTYGGSYIEEFYTMTPFEDGYLVGATGFSTDGYVPENNGVSDYWLFKLKGLTVSTDDLNEVIFDVYPNPAHDLLKITTKFHQINSLSFVDLLGRVVLKQSNLNSNEVTVDMKHLEAGTYFLKLESNAKMVTKSVIKM